MSSGNRVVPCGQTDRHDEAKVAFRNFENAPKQKKKDNIFFYRRAEFYLAVMKAQGDAAAEFAHDSRRVRRRQQAAYCVSTASAASHYVSALVQVTACAQSPSRVTRTGSALFILGGLCWNDARICKLWLRAGTGNIKALFYFPLSYCTPFSL